MRVCMDFQAAISQHAGVGRYTRSLAEHLARTRGPDDLRLVYFDFKRRGLQPPIPGATERAVTWCPGRLAQLAWKTLRWPAYEVFAGAADLYHFPNFILPPGRRGRRVVTIHDVSFVRYPQFTETRNLSWLRTHIESTVRRTDAIITDSHFSAREIRDCLRSGSTPVFPIHLGVAPHFRRPAAARIPETLVRYALSQPYLLSVGTLEPRKNYEFLVDVFERLTAFDGLLVIAGMRGWKYEPILERIRRSPLAPRIRYLEYVRYEDLPALYAGAELFLFPTFYEGFGLPPLECMACGTPVVSSNAASLPEVLGDAALVMDDAEAEAWVHGIQRLLVDRAQRSRLVERGSAMAARYRWEETARQTWEVYRKVCA